MEIPLLFHPVRQVKLPTEAPALALNGRMSDALFTRPQTQPDVRQVMVNGLSHRVLSWRPTVVTRDAFFLCHGYLDHAESFGLLANELLKTGAVVFASDFRGHGDTDWVKDPGYYYFPDYVRDLRAILAELQIGAFHLLGHSMGGTVAAMYGSTFATIERIEGARQPGAPTLKSLTLVEGLGPPESSLGDLAERPARWLLSLDRMRTQVVREIQSIDEAVQRIRTSHPKLPVELLTWVAEISTRKTSSGKLRWAFDPLHRTPTPMGFRTDVFLELLTRISVPTWVVNGSEGFQTADHSVRRNAIQTLKGETTLAGAGHMMHWTHAQELSAILQNLAGLT